MVKCPNCETFNTELVDYVDDFCGSIAAHYECVCGTKFHINHYADSNIQIDKMPKLIEEREREMIQCPNCGNTAQVKETFSNYSICLKAQCNSYECRCGCLFHIWKYRNGRTYGEWHAPTKK